MTFLSVKVISPVLSPKNALTFVSDAGTLVFIPKTLLNATIIRSAQTPA